MCACVCACACACVCVCVCVCVQINYTWSLEALVTKFHFVGKSNISRHMQKSIHATNMIPTVRPGWDKKTCTFHGRSAYIGLHLILLPECGLAGMWWNHQMNCHQMNCHLEMV